MKKKSQLVILLAVCCAMASAREYHVSPGGNDMYEGTAGRPFRTISAAARLAQPGDVVTVHEGVYREQIIPPRGGASDRKRIVYQAAPGEKVIVKGSEPVTGWQRVQNDTWKVLIPNRFFGEFNPYDDLIRGDWFYRKGRDHHTGAVYLDGHWLTEAAKREAVMAPAGTTALWFAEVDETTTTIWAQFKEVNPNEADVEINVRQTVFYPEKPGRNYITVRGFTMMHAATNWAPPTAEQVGLLGTHWSKGWIIENNDISYSVCTGVTLGKYGDDWDNRSESAPGYVETIRRGLANGWSKENIGSHIVRNNHISHCEQAGIVGSLGPIFCKITGNEIHDIHVRQLFSGAEMAGIKFHGAIDTVISGNHIYRTSRGLWLDWMTQGTRVTRNLFHDNLTSEDLFVEVNHGPFLVEHNILLSPNTLTDWSEGGAYVHNLFAGQIRVRPELGRETPYHPPHSTAIAGLSNIRGGDNRFFNNIFVGGNGLTAYDEKGEWPVRMAGNVFLQGAAAAEAEQNHLVLPEFDPDLELTAKEDAVYLQIRLDDAWAKMRPRQLVTTERLGRAKIPDLAYVLPDGSPYRLDSDYHGKERNTGNPFPGPFKITEKELLHLKVWPLPDRETTN